jgi:hypothetical protein
MNWLKRLWQSTVFPGMIQEYHEEKDLKRSIRRQAKLEAITELKDHLKDHYKKQELDKMSGKKKKDWLAKLAKGFETSGNNFNEKMGMGSSSGTQDPKTKKKGPKGIFDDPEEKIRRMLGGK